MRLAIDAYSITKQLPNREVYGLVSQINRCAISIPSNIAEGQQRNNRAEFRQFIGIARGSAAELETQLIIVNKVYGLEVKPALDDLLEIQKMLTILSQKLK